MSRFNEHGLTQQQEAFAVAVAAGSNLSDAYRKAYPRSLKWAPETVHEAASRLAANSKVSARIAALRTAAEKVSTLEAARVMDEIAKLAHSDISGVWHEDGRVKLPHELDPVTRAAVASFEIDAKGVIKYRFWDKNAALEKAAKILGLFEKDNKQKTDPLQSLLDSLSGNVIGPKKGIDDGL
jgi:phage terminase small subunit